MSSKINIKFLKKLNPLTTSVWGLVIWFILFIMAPLRVKENIGFLPFLYLLLNYVFFWFGIMALTRKPFKNTPTFIPNKKVLYNILQIILAIAILGVLLKLFDKFYLRGTDLENSISENRVELSKSGPNIISIISAITTPLSFLPLFIYYLGGFKKRKLHWLCLVVFFSTSFEFITVGSRSGLFIILLLLSIYFYYFKRLKLSKRKLFLIGIALYVIGIFSINLFIERTTDFTKSDEKSVVHILTRANYNYTIEPTNSARNNILQTKNKTYQATKLGAVNFMQYYLHGMYEFGYLYNNFDKEHAYGAYSFNVFVKFVNIILRTNIDLEEVEKKPPRTGIFFTFFGSLFIDFGWFSLAFMFVFGVLQKIVYNNVILGRYQYLPLLFYLLIVNIFMPVISFLKGAQGLYTITAFIIFPILYSLLTQKVILKKTKDSITYIKLLK